MNFTVYMRIWRLLSLLAGSVIAGVIGGLVLGWMAWGRH
jgi:hypothetical protein